MKLSRSRELKALRTQINTVFNEMISIATRKGSSEGWIYAGKLIHVTPLLDKRWETTPRKGLFSEKEQSGATKQIKGCEAGRQTGGHGVWTDGAVPTSSISWVQEGMAGKMQQNFKRQEKKCSELPKMKKIIEEDPETWGKIKSANKRKKYSLIQHLFNVINQKKDMIGGICMLVLCQSHVWKLINMFYVFL